MLLGASSAQPGSPASWPWRWPRPAVPNRPNDPAARGRQRGARQPAGLRGQCRRSGVLRIRFFRAHAAVDRDAREAGAVAAESTTNTPSRSKAMPTSAARASTTSRSAPGARRRCATIWPRAAISAAAHAHDFLRQGAPGRGVQRHFVLVAEPPRGDGAQYQFLSRGYGGRGQTGAFGRRLCFQRQAASTLHRGIVISACVRVCATLAASAVCSCPHCSTTRG